MIIYFFKYNLIIKNNFFQIFFLKRNMDLYQSKYSRNHIKKFKERLKDRHKINGIKFNYIKKEDKKYSVGALMKENDQKRIYNEYEEFMLLQNYNKLKHQIFVREQKEKEKIKKEQEFFKEFHVDFNYTTILKIIQQFLGLKSNDKINPFNYDIKSGRMAIERADRNIKANRINEMLKRIILHFMKIKTKLDIKKDNLSNEYITPEIVDEIKRKILKHKKNLQSKNSKLFFEKDNFKKNDKSSNNIKYDRNKNNKSKSNLYLNSISRKSKSNYNNINSNDINSFHNKIRYTSSAPSDIERRPSIIINLEKVLTNSSINYINSKKEEHNISEDLINRKKIRRNSYYFNESKEKKIINKVKEMYNLKKGRKTVFSFVPNLIKKDKNNIYNKEELKRQNSTLLIEDNSRRIPKSSFKRTTQYLIKKNKTNNKMFYRPKSCINLLYKDKEKNDINWINSNNNWYKNNSCFNGRKSHLKVKNLPLYTTKIGDLVNEYNRIKKSSKKLKINYKEKHFSTYEEIDNIIKIKEDMLMFLLKQKYFNCRFPKKKLKVSILK